MQNQTTQSNQSFSWAAGQQWFYQGMHLLKTLGGLWIMVWGMYGLAAMLLSQIEPRLFYLVFAVVAPLATVGIYNACYHAKKQQNGGRSVQFSDYMVAWKVQTVPLLKLGIILLCLGFVSEAVTRMIFEALGLVIDETLPPDVVIKNALIGQVISMVVSIPLLIVATFSPQLIFFHKQSIPQALKSSYLAFTRAWKALLMLTLMVVALVFVVAMIGALFSAFLGAVAIVLMSGALLIIVSINLCGQFFAFDAIFPIDDNNADDGAGTDADNKMPADEIHKEI